MREKIVELLARFCSREQSAPTDKAEKGNDLKPVVSLQYDHYTNYN